MKTKTVKAEEYQSLRVSSLPSRPTAPTSFGGAGYTASEVKAAFDRLPLFIIGKLNGLIEDIMAEGEESIAAAMPTGLKDAHTLCDLFQDIRSGGLADYLTVGEETLGQFKARISSELLALTERLEEAYARLIAHIEEG